MFASLEGCAERSTEDGNSTRIISIAPSQLSGSQYSKPLNAGESASGPRTQDVFKRRSRRDEKVCSFPRFFSIATCLVTPAIDDEAGLAAGRASSRGLTIAVFAGNKRTISSRAIRTEAARAVAQARTETGRNRFRRPAHRVAAF